MEWYSETLNRSDLSNVILHSDPSVAPTDPYQLLTDMTIGVELEEGKKAVIAIEILSSFITSLLQSTWTDSISSSFLALHSSDPTNIHNRKILACITAQDSESTFECNRQYIGKDFLELIIKDSPENSAI